jgi:hypothetical protein
MGERAMRPFWIHQAAEYLIGMAVVATAIQDPEAVVRALDGDSGDPQRRRRARAAGSVQVVRTIGPQVDRPLPDHRDPLVAIQPFADVHVAGRGIMLITLVPYAFLWFYTDWAERPARKERRAATAGPTGEKIGRSAGRLAGNGYLAAKQAIKKRTDSE